MDRRKGRVAFVNILIVVGGGHDRCVGSRSLRRFGAVGIHTRQSMNTILRRVPGHRDRTGAACTGFWKKPRLLGAFPSDDIRLPSLNARSLYGNGNASQTVTGMPEENVVKQQLNVYAESRTLQAPLCETKIGANHYLSAAPFLST